MFYANFLRKVASPRSWVLRAWAAKQRERALPPAPSPPKSPACRPPPAPQSLQPAPAAAEAERSRLLASPGLRLCSPRFGRSPWPPRSVLRRRSGGRRVPPAARGGRKQVGNAFQTALARSCGAGSGGQGSRVPGGAGGGGVSPLLLCRGGSGWVRAKPSGGSGQLGEDVPLPGGCRDRPTRCTGEQEVQPAAGARRGRKQRLAADPESGISCSEACQAVPHRSQGAVWIRELSPLNSKSVGSSGKRGAGQCQRQLPETRRCTVTLLLPWLGELGNCCIPLPSRGRLGSERAAAAQLMPEAARRALALRRGAPKRIFSCPR